MKFYLASRFSRREELRTYRTDLHQLGHIVTSSWIDLEAEDPSQAVQCAKRDILDIRNADCLIAFTEPERCEFTRGGRHYEAGYAYAVGKRLILCGPVENVFYTMDDWEKFPDWPALITKLGTEPHKRRPKVVQRKIGAKNPKTTIVLTPWESLY
jgi:nucleoside 2-deoxyribosyltransferase